MTRPGSAVLLCCLTLMGAMASAQDGLRPAGRTLGALAVRDIPLAQGMSVRLDIRGESQDGELRDGMIEALLAQEVVVLGEETDAVPNVELTLVPRGPLDGVLRVSVVAYAPTEGRYVSSRAYAVPLEEPTMLETLGAPLVVISAAVLVVYLLLTVRSS